jgi:acetylornithine deacetylase
MMDAGAPVDFIRRLVAFDTISWKSNPELIAFVADDLRGQRIALHLVPSADGAKASLLATIGPNAPGGVVLSGHTDSVPGKHQAKTAGPADFKLGVTCGHGECDAWSSTLHRSGRPRS